MEYFATEERKLKSQMHGIRTVLPVLQDHTELKSTNFLSSFLCLSASWRTTVQCCFSRLCHHSFASFFALGNHFLSQELHVSQSHYTDTHGTPTHPVHWIEVSLVTSYQGNMYLESLPWGPIFGHSTEGSGWGAQLICSWQAHTPELQPKAPSLLPLWLQGRLLHWHLES